MKKPLTLTQTKTFAAKSIFTLILLTFFFSADATDYYLAANGNDGNSGTSSSSPWQTINKLNSVLGSLNPGDNVYFNRGDVFYGALNIKSTGYPSSPITFGAYGSGANPVITGFTNVTSWTNIGGNIWESTNAVSSLSSCNMVVVNGVNTAMGRYPNSGYLTYESYSGNTSITSSSLSGSSDWTGAEAVIKKDRYIIDRNPITSQSGSTLYYSGGGYYNGKSGWGFFIQNDSRTLDQQNEWYYNPSTNKIRIYSTNSPNGVQISSIDNIVYSVYENYINFNNLSFTGGNNSAFYLGSSGNVSIQNCSIDFCYNGILGKNFGGSSANFVLKNSTINHCNNTSVNIPNEFSNALLTNNIIRNTGMIAGMGGSGDGTYEAINVLGTNTMVQNNEVDSTGYIGIDFNGDFVTISKNLVNYFCMLKDDGGGIYTDNASIGKVISYNTVINGVGNSDGTSFPGTTRAHGIFLDENASGVQILNNSVANVGFAGIFLHNFTNVNVLNNTIYNTAEDILLKNDVATNYIRNTIVKNNIFFTRDATQLNLKAITTHNDVSSFGVIDSNFYARPIDDNLIMDIQPNGQTGDDNYYSLSQWQAYSGFDANSKKSPKSITDLNDLKFVYNETGSNKTVSLPYNYIDVKNNSYNGSINLAPYSSAVLIKNGAATSIQLLPAVNPGNTISGLNYKYYEGNAYSVVPDFSTLTPVKTGTISNFDISVANNANNFAFNFTGYVNVPADGQYTFYTTSDDGSNLLIDGVPVVSNDGLHASTENSGVIGLKAGLHAIYVGYFQQLGNKILTVSYAGPGISKQLIPSSSLFTDNVGSSLLPAVNPSNTISGINYKYYEANGYNNVPDFSSLTPVKTGTSSNFDISVANRVEVFAFNFTGYINVPADGQYTFYTSSDDGSNLNIDGIQVVNNDGLHSVLEKSGTIGLKAGMHVISIGYFQQLGDKILTVSYAGPGISKQPIPSSALFTDNVGSSLLPAANPSNTISGINYKYYEANGYDNVPDFSPLTPVKTGTSSNFDISVANRVEVFAFNFTGYINVPADGQYTFYTSSDDGSNLNIDGIQVVNNDGLHSVLEKSGTIGLKAGMHAIFVGYFQQLGDKILTVSYAGPGISKQIIPSSSLYSISGIGSLGLNNNSQLLISSNLMGAKAYPNPFTNYIEVNIPGAAGKYNLVLVDVSGKIIWTKDGIKNEGDFQQSINTSALQRGVYFLKIIQGTTNTVIKLVK